MIELKDDEIKKVAEITGVSYYDIQKLYTMGLLHESNTLDYIVKHDFESIRKMGKYRTSQIVQRICMKYHISKYKVLNAIYKKRNSLYYCTQCDKKIPKSEYVRNDGLCDHCVATSIDL